MILTGLKIKAGARVQTGIGEATLGAGLVLKDFATVASSDEVDTNVMGLLIVDCVNSLPMVVTSGNVEVTNVLTPNRVLVLGRAGEVQYDTDLDPADVLKIIGRTTGANSLVVDPRG